MNKSDRKQLEEALSLLYRAKDMIDIVSEAEMNKYDNLTEGLQATEKGQRYESNADALTEQSNDIESIIDNINDLMNE